MIPVSEVDEGTNRRMSNSNTDLNINCSNETLPSLLSRV